MEASPLVLAHTHARNASIETKRANPVAASEEHDLAAAEFATAAQTSNDSEAIRILNLLEQQHRKLGQIIKTRHERPIVEDVEPRAATKEATAMATAAEASKLKDDARSTSPDSTQGPPRLPRTGRSSARELSSSIASNLATARGIPNPRQKRPTPISPLVSNQHADGLTQQELRRDSPTPTQRPSWAPPLTSEEDTSTATNTADAPFQQFYNTFESLMSKLSAPLAFAGLPLASSPSGRDTPADAPATPIKPTKPESQSTVDYSHLISRAALRAVSSTYTPSTAPHESFYFVPTTGHTLSYAEIMNRADREEARAIRSQYQNQTRPRTSSTDQDFMDAKSTMLPKPKKGTTTEPKVNGKTMEELTLENDALRHVTDKLAKRLHIFEMSSQTSTAALAQSIRSMPRSPLATPQTSRKAFDEMTSPTNTKSRGTGSGGASGPNDRIQELEDILRKSDAVARKKEAENVKLRETLKGYRDRWEDLKSNARARRQGQGHGQRDGMGGGESPA